MIPAILLNLIIVALVFFVTFMIVLGVLMPYFVWRIHRSLIDIKEHSVKEVKLSRQLLSSYGFTPQA